MKFNELTIDSYDKPKRVGRGIASGKGKTAGRGTKGQGARAGSSKRPGFEGGQNPLMQRTPKLRGFKSHRTAHENVLTGQLEQFSGKVVDAKLLSEHGLASNPFVRVKLLVGGGELTKKVTVKLQAASESAVALVEKAGGTFETVPRASRPASEKRAKKTEDKPKKA